MQVLCFDIGGTDIKYGVVKDGKIVCKYSMKTDASTKESITKQIGRASCRERVSYIV